MFVRDRQLGLTERVSLANNGAEANNDSGYCCESVSISGDGRYVAFESYASNLVAGDTNFALDIFVRDRTAGATARVNVSSAGAEANDFTFYPVLSGNGRHVAFQSYADNLAPDGNFASDVFVHDLADADGDGTWDAIDTNDDNDMLADNTEAFCNSNPLFAGSLPERVDTPGDDNGDTSSTKSCLPAARSMIATAMAIRARRRRTSSPRAGNTAGDQDPCGTNGWPADLASAAPSTNRITLMDMTSFVAPAPRKLNRVRAMRATMCAGTWCRGPSLGSTSTCSI